MLTGNNTTQLEIIISKFNPRFVTLQLISQTFTLEETSNVVPPKLGDYSSASCGCLGP